MIELDGVTKRYGGVVALDDVSLSFGEGVHALVGPNGSGKTTALRIIAGLTRPTSGTARAPDVGIAFQRPNVYPELSVAENAAVFGRMVGAPAERREQLLSELRLAPARDRPARDLSDGYRKKLDVALALLKAPEVLLLDEPLADLDDLTERRLLGVVRRRAGTTLVSTHRVGHFEGAVDRLAVLFDGRVVLDAPADDLDGGPAAAYERVLDDLDTPPE
jgi:ABC-2 type transport system ATP-binding protein